MVQGAQRDGHETQLCSPTVAGSITDQGPRCRALKSTASRMLTEVTCTKGCSLRVARVAGLRRQTHSRETGDTSGG